MRFVFHYPELSGPHGDLLDAGDFGEVAAAAERSGFSAISVSEHPAPAARWLNSGGHQTLDPFVALSFAAARTSRLRLLTYLAVAPYRNPALLAKQAATLDRLSAGRLILGLGAGYQKSEFHALGVDFEERNTLFDEVLDVLPLHWKGEPFSYRGSHFSARDVQALPRPAQDPIPVWIGGNSGLSRRRAASRAQGWMPMSGPPRLADTARTPVLGESAAELGALIAQLRAAADAAGRDGRALDVLHSYRDEGLADPEHEPERHLEAFAALEKAGVTWTVVSAPTLPRAFPRTPLSRSDSRPAGTVEFIEAFGRACLSDPAAEGG